MASHFHVKMWTLSVLSTPSRIIIIGCQIFSREAGEARVIQILSHSAIKKISNFIF